MKKIKKIIVTSYNPDRPQIFEQEASKIKEVLGSNCIAIHHVGSTYSIADPDNVLKIWQ